MPSQTLDASMTRLENIKGNKHLYNKNKIAEAEALAAEALRMANEAKMAAARLAEVKKTLSMFSNKLEKAEQSVQKDIKTVPVVKKVVPAETVKEEPPAQQDPVEEAPAAEATVEKDAVAAISAIKLETADIFSNEIPTVPTAPTAVVTKNLVNDDVVKVVEVKATAKAAPKDPAIEAPAPIVVKRDHDIVEDFLDGLGVDKMCGLDDTTLGFNDGVPAPPPSKPEIFENPTKMLYKTLSAEEMVHPSSTSEDFAAAQREARKLQTKYAQRSQSNTDFADPFGVDHDDLVLCGKIADLCEPPEFDDDEINDIKYQ